MRLDIPTIAVLQRKQMCKTGRKVDIARATEISSIQVGSGQAGGLPFLIDDCHFILCRHSYPEQAAFIESHGSVRCFIAGINLIYM